MGRRRRRDHPASSLFPMSDAERLAELAESIREHGQRQPIVMYEGRILDGRNRWEACALADLEPRVQEWDGEGSPYQLVWDLNAERRDLTPGQRAAIKLNCLEADEAWLAKQAKRRKKANAKRSAATKSQPRTPDRRRLSGAVSRDTAPEAPPKARERDLLAAAARTSPATASRVISLRKKAPKLFDKVVSGEMVLAEAQRELRRKKKKATAARIAAEPAPLPEGPWRVIAVDPPWRYEQSLDDSTSKVRGLVDYPDMSVEEICALPVAELAHDDCILFLWITNAMLADGSGARVLEAWGFTPKTILTWDKVHLGTGHWLRNVTEHCIVATRGKPAVNLTNQTTMLREKRREHSRKPDGFYEIVEALCPGSKLEMFARESRAGWTAWGAELQAFAAVGPRA